MTLQEAFAIGQDSLIWLAGEPELLGRFLEGAGLAPGDLRERAADPVFLGFVLEFLLASDRMVLDFATAAGVPAEAPARARALLAGGELPNWT